MEFESPDALRAWLAARHVPVQRWGRNTAKSVEHLWHELRLGECELRDAPLLRVTSVVVVWLRRGPRCLLELWQEWADGRVRERGVPPSDKLQRDEPWDVGALRCLWEELALPASRVRLGDVPREEWVDRASPSYPGLPCRYHSFHVDATAATLPDGPFRTAEQNPTPGDPVRFHAWAWRPCDESPRRD